MIPTKLLLVDDEEEFVSALAERLRIRKYDVRVVTSGEDALLAISTERPDIVLLDLKMPGIDGMETLKRIKASDPSIHVIMVTGSVDAQAGAQSLKAGATYHMVKPFDIETLCANIRMTPISQ
jgi:DNA-binding response OmpR family regulator